MAPSASSRPTVYVALLRGINVGGKNMISMQALKGSFEALGFHDVTTYINSGNVLFRSARRDARELERQIDQMLTREFGIPARTVVRSFREMARLIKTIATTWKPDPAWRYNVVFLRHEIDSESVLADRAIDAEVERVVYCPGTVLWSARVDALTRSTFVKLPALAVYRNMTTRNLNTTTKLFELMQRMEQRP
jgi:uncharacterized protein (DUF1697 family)